MVIIGTAAVTPRIGLRARAAVIVTMLPPGLLRQHLPDGELGNVQEALEVRRDDRPEVLGRVVRKRLGDEDAGVIDQYVDRMEASQR